MSCCSTELIPPFFYTHLLTSRKLRASFHLRHCGPVTAMPSELRDTHESMTAHRLREETSHVADVSVLSCDLTQTVGEKKKPQG